MIYFYLYVAMAVLVAVLTASTLLLMTPSNSHAHMPDQRIVNAVEVAANAYDVKPELILAVIQTESSFRPHAKSPQGAQGLMQLMPRTAVLMGVVDVWNVEQNIMGGTRYLAEMMEMFGSTRKALIAYNWGPGNVIKKGVKNMPQETRDYLEIVLRHYTHFTKEYPK